MRRLTLIALFALLFAPAAYSQIIDAETMSYQRKTSLADSLRTNYGVRPRLNAKTWFNLRPNVATVDTVQSWFSPGGTRVAYMDSTGNMQIGPVLKIGTSYYISETSGVALLPLVKTLNGTVSDPSLTFYTDTDTGIYRIAPNRLGIAAKGANVATFDSTGVSVTGVAKADTFKVSTALKWGLSPKDFVLAAVDSAGAFTTYSAGHDSSQTRARNRSYLDFTHVNTNSLQQISMGAVIPLLFTTTPDSIMFDAWGTAGSDSLKFRIRVKSAVAAASALYDSGWKVLTLMSTWTHFAGVMPAFTRNEEYEVLIEVQAKNNARGLVSGIQFK